MIGYISERAGLGAAISMAAVVYVAAGILLVTGIVAFVRRDAARMHAQLEAERIANRAV